MESIKINLINPVYGIREMPIMYFFMDNDRLKIVFYESENHKLNIGQHLTFIRYIYGDDDIPTVIQDDVRILGFDTYEESGVLYDCIYVTIPIKRKLALDKTETQKTIYWDKTNGGYTTVDYPTVDYYDYVFDDNSVISTDFSSLTQEEIDALPEHVYTFETGIYGVRKYQKLYPAGVIPDEDMLEEIIIETMTSEGIVIPPEYLDNIFEYIDDSLSGVDDYSGADNMLDHLYAIGAFDVDRYKEYYVLTFDENHNIFQQDIDLLAENQISGGYYINVYDSEMNKIGYLYDIQIPYVDNLLPVEKDTSITEWEEETCNMFDLDGNPYNITYHKYIFAPSRFSRKGIIVNKAETGYVEAWPTDTPTTLNNKKIVYLLQNGFWFEPAYNPYFYTVQLNNSNWCTMWGDIWWDKFQANNGAIPQKDIWFNSGNTHVALTVDNSYWNVPTIFSSDDEFTSLNTDEDGIYGYINNIITNALPKTLDFERVKYVPAYFGDDVTSTEFTKASEIVYRFHFRERVKKSGPEYSIIPEAYRPYEDGWYVSQDSGATIWWNEMQYSSTNINHTDMADFVSSQSAKSDMLGYLNFTDDDVFFGKSKIAKSFVRFSFYTSNDPIEQKLLYYSTAFLDINELRTKYLKLLIINGKKPGKLEKPFVLTDVSDNRLDTTIRLTDEHNTKKSGEGFNLYLFLEDAPVENTEKTIYMKVEFNHAGNGKTIPMILWPTIYDGITYKKVYTSLTVSNFLENLYIPIKIRYINGEYLYKIVGSELDGDTIKVTLFEPKLDIENITGSQSSLVDNNTYNY